MSINAFVDNGYTPGKDFCEKFLSSTEFTVETLRLILSGTSNLKKDNVAIHIADALEKGKLTPEQILLPYVKQSRTWLSLKSGSCTITPNLNSAKSLLTEFGKEGWYGPIEEAGQHKKKWYIRIYRIVDYVRRGSGSASKLDERYIRWSVIAEVAKDYVALSWNGFTYSSTTDEQIEQRTQFPFWNHIPTFIDELASHCNADWKARNLHQLVLHDMWEKYLNKSIDGIVYKWKHLRIRAEASGLAINAHSAGVEEIDVRGLQALSEKLAHSVLNKLGLVGDPEKMGNAEDAILLTLIKEWGTKSYEFQLDRELTPSEIEAKTLKKVTRKPLIKTHCYFGLKPDSKTQDSFPHLKCYGGSTSVLEFLLKELQLQG
ncbi:hypothetical protein H6G54_20680 [Anabaena cylindrica FACHB-243]|uniref:Uncharacterized protein n=1 Tax=Anabaena cylindrica (strain ATCC 27899 / PCC 7122) TaxID=272123 RepID=K9ZK94_ANACC|nr:MULTISPECIES: hypothetical protein [Anabaena]AFZ58730.1 hypothetical protein Anacy_3326 [Anabaena cylindrica PCC 7122]MBD2420072.1 hypothetical protein [Anabaena cylindrica FACHB-243]MBY5282957.1 hypothetical protein [Anabaena sp. CCAP 1446/1C]MBY5306544.1 hypothetical protein [Anabaena sp. CCAP 1446/1C]MCM2407031.1 hypothetical protein [Anabaena sp. CCAP 1446/1C]